MGLRFCQPVVGALLASEDFLYECNHRMTVVEPEQAKYFEKQFYLRMLNVFNLQYLLFIKFLRIDILHHHAFSWKTACTDQ